MLFVLYLKERETKKSDFDDELECLIHRTISNCVQNVTILNLYDLLRIHIKFLIEKIKQENYKRNEKQNEEKWKTFK